VKPTTVAAIGGQPVHPTNPDREVWGLSYREYLVAQLAASIATGCCVHHVVETIRPGWIAETAIATADAVLAALAAECQQLPVEIEEIDQLDSLG